MPSRIASQVGGDFHRQPDTFDNPEPKSHSFVCVYVCQDGWILGVFFFAWLYGLREVKVQEQKRMKPMTGHLDQKGLVKKDLFTLFFVKVNIAGIPE